MQVAMLSGGIKPIHAERPLLRARSGMFNNDAVKAYPERGASKPGRWTIAGPNCPNEVWIRRASPYGEETGYTVAHRHSGGCFPRIFAPLPFEIAAANAYDGHKPTHTISFIEAFALASQLVRAYGSR